MTVLPSQPLRRAPADEFVLVLDWTDPFHGFTDMLQITQLNFFEILPMGCVYRFDHYSMLVASTVVPFAIGALIALAYVARAARLAPPDRAELLAHAHGVRAKKFGGGETQQKERSTGALAVVWVAQKTQDLWSQHVNALLLLSFIVLPTSSVAIFNTFNCETFDTGASHLRADLGRACYTAEHRAMMGSVSWARSGSASTEGC